MLDIVATQDAHAYIKTPIPRGKNSQPKKCSNCYLIFYGHNAYSLCKKCRKNKYLYPVNKTSTTSKYNLTIEEYYNKLKSQNGKCASCEKGIAKRPMLDHNHYSNKIINVIK